MFDEMSDRELAPDVMCCNILTDGFLRKGDSDVANEIWETLIKDSLVYPNVVTYTVAISGLCNCGKFNEGLEFWQRLKKNDRQQDLFTYSTLIHGLCKSGNVDVASRVYAEMVESGVSPDVEVYNALLNGYCQAGKIKESFELWDLMGKESLCNAVSFNIFIRGLFDNGKVDEAMSIWAHEFEKDFLAGSLRCHFQPNDLLTIALK